MPTQEQECPFADGQRVTVTERLEIDWGDAEPTAFVDGAIVLLPYTAHGTIVHWSATTQEVGVHWDLYGLMYHSPDVLRPITRAEAVARERPVRRGREW